MHIVIKWLEKDATRSYQYYHVINPRFTSVQYSGPLFVACGWLLKQKLTVSLQLILALASDSRIIDSSCLTVILQLDLTPPPVSRCLRCLYCSTKNSAASSVIFGLNKRAKLMYLEPMLRLGKLTNVKIKTSSIHVTTLLLFL